MIRIKEENDKVKWLSEESDWSNSDGLTIAVWDGCLIKEKEYKDFIDFIKKVAKADVEPIGNFLDDKGINLFVFLVKSNITKFSIWRFSCPGIKWWYDTFWSLNGGRIVKDSEILPIIEKLGLKIKKEVTDVIFNEN